MIDAAPPSALLPVGRDCDCGFPLVWHWDGQRCAVYGTHPPRPPAPPKVPHPAVLLCAGMG